MQRCASVVQDGPGRRGGSAVNGLESLRSRLGDLRARLRAGGKDKMEGTNASAAALGEPSHDESAECLLVVKTKPLNSNMKRVLAASAAAIFLNLQVGVSAMVNSVVQNVDFVEVSAYKKAILVDQSMPSPAMTPTPRE